MKKKKYLAFIVMLICTCVANSQIMPAPSPPPPPPGLPVDGGLFFLIASGLIYGVRKLKS